MRPDGVGRTNMSAGIRAAAAVVAGLVAGCGGPAFLAELAEEQSCRETVLVGLAGRPAMAADTGGGAPAPAPGVAADDAPPADDGAAAALAEALEVEWRLPPDGEQLLQLNAWCAAVGPAVAGGWPPVTADSVVADSLLVVSWNVHIGGGDLRGLVRDLRSGALTGAAVEHFALLLQEAHRSSDTLIPDYDPDLPGGSPVRAAPPSGERADIVAEAEALGLSLFYAPSMRNGEGEDRGNAVLATMPLRDPVAISLPVARQRRVATTADVTGRTTTGEAWGLQLTSVHLESDARGLASDAGSRYRQAAALLDALPDADGAVVAGDFNTRRPGDEAVLRLMQDALPDAPPYEDGITYTKLFGLYRATLDHAFLRLPDGARARIDRAPTPYGSDHWPLLVWVVF